MKLRILISILWMFAAGSSCRDVPRPPDLNLEFGDLSQGCPVGSPDADGAPVLALTSDRSESLFLLHIGREPLEAHRLQRPPSADFQNSFIAAAGDFVVAGASWYVNGEWNAWEAVLVRRDGTVLWDKSGIGNIERRIYVDSRGIGGAACWTEFSH